MKTAVAGLFILGMPFTLVLAQPPAAPPAGPQVNITLKDRHGRASPHRQGFSHTGGGNMDVSQPAPDTIVVTMTAVAVAGAHPCNESVGAMNFDLEQNLEIALENPKLKRARLTLEGRVIGLLRSHSGGGSAQEGPARATVTGGNAGLVGLELPCHGVSCGDNLSVNDRQGPVGVAVVAGDYHLHQSFAVSASHPWSLRMCKAASSEFAPDPALDPLWISYWEPFHGAIKKDFGFQVVLKVAPE